MITVVSFIRININKIWSLVLSIKWVQNKLKSFQFFKSIKYLDNRELSLSLGKFNLINVSIYSYLMKVSKHTKRLLNMKAMKLSKTTNQNKVYYL